MAYSSVYEVALSIVAYSVCSGTLVLLNKMTLYHLPFPSLVTTFQLTMAVGFIFSAKGMGWLPVDPFKMEFIIPYLYYIIGFALGVYCNMKSLTQANVETVIVAKALSPCLVAFLDAFFLGREYPSIRSWAAIALIGVGAIGYASQDEKFQTQGASAYFWPFCYLLAISFEMAYGKSLLKSVKMKTQSGPVLYTNFLGIVPMLLFATLGGEFEKMKERIQGEETLFTSAAILLLALGSVAGTGIGYSSWWCRGKVSATSFTIIGVMNKCLTILLNLVVWDQHAAPGGIFSLLLCLAGGSLYRQAPMRKVRTQRIDDEDDVWETELTVEESNALVDAIGEEGTDSPALAKRRPSSE